MSPDEFRALAILNRALLRHPEVKEDGLLSYRELKEYWGPHLHIVKEVKHRWWMSLLLISENDHYPEEMWTFVEPNEYQKTDGWYFEHHVNMNA